MSLLIAGAVIVLISFLTGAGVVGLTLVIQTRFKTEDRGREEE